jgi:hypothetical protein
MIQQHLSTRRDQNSRKSQRTKGERHEQERCDRRHETTQGRISVSGIRDILENVGLRSTDLNRCNNDILTGSKNQRGRIAPLQCVRLSAPCHTPRGRGAGARTNGGSVRPARPAASGPKQTQTKRQRHVPESIARMCARAAFPDCPVDRTLPRRDGDLTKRTQKGLWNSIRGFLVPPPACCLPWICHYIMTFFSYYRRPAESGGLAYLHPSNLNVARVSLTCFPRATCTMRPRGVGQNRHRVVLCYRHSVCPNSLLNSQQGMLSTGRNQPSGSGDWRRRGTTVSVLPLWRFAGSSGVNSPFLSLELPNAGIGRGY